MAVEAVALSGLEAVALSGLEAVALSGLEAVASSGLEAVALSGLEAEGGGQSAGLEACLIGSQKFSCQIFRFSWHLASVTDLDRP